MGVRSEESQPHTSPPAQGSSARKISPHIFWLQHHQRLSQWKKLLEPHKQTYLDSLPLELQDQSSSLRGTGGIQGGTEASGIKARAEGQLSPREKGEQRPLSLF